MEPITFTPLYMERVWGGRSLETTYNRELPHPNTPFGESWEMVDRVEAQSVVACGKYEGTSLNTLWQESREEVFGLGLPDTERFPLLIKILDAQADLSVQVHPPDEAAKRLGGEPKTEMWYIAQANPGAQLYVGVKNGVTKDQFQSAIADGEVEDCIHAITAQAGESIHIESGRLHAIGAGLVIYEIQQNSDTTYRVYDWNRLGLDGTPRELHVEESMQCINFADTEPTVDEPKGSILSTCEHFQVDKYRVTQGQSMSPIKRERFAIITVITGKLISEEGLEFQAGDFFLMPVEASPLQVTSDTVYLETTLP